MRRLAFLFYVDVWRFIVLCSWFYIVYQVITQFLCPIRTITHNAKCPISTYFCPISTRGELSMWVILRQQEKPNCYNENR